LLTLYLTSQLLLPGHVEHVRRMAGLAPDRIDARSVIVTAFATQISGLYGVWSI